MSKFFTVAALSCLALACGGVTQAGDGDGDGDGDRDAAADAPVDAPVDADLCPDLVAPPGSLLLHDRLCGTSLGFNGTDSMTLPCPDPSGDPNPGTHGVILEPATATMADGCDATAPITRMIAPANPNALVQNSTTADLDLTEGDLFRMRVSCPNGVADCLAQLQVTATDAAGNNNIFFPPAGGFEIINPDTIVNIEVPIPANLAGGGVRFNLINRTDGNGTADLLYQNPHVAPGP